MKSESFMVLFAASTMVRHGAQRGTDLGLEVLERLRRHRRRDRNLAELRALDAARLADIGLSAAARARMVG